jgi:hypothetical protein
MTGRRASALIEINAIELIQFGPRSAPPAACCGRQMTAIPMPSRIGTLPPTKLNPNECLRELPPARQAACDLFEFCAGRFSD